MPRPPRPLPEHLADEPFDRADLEAARRSQGRTRRKDLTRPFHGVYVAERPDTVLERCRAYAVRLRPGQVFSHTTAALLHGLPLPARLEEDELLHVAAVRPASPPRTVGVVGHRLPVAPPKQTIDGLPVVAPSEAWCELAGDLTLDELIAVADHLLTASPFDEGTTRTLLEHRIGAFHRPADSLLRESLRWARRPVRSPRETEVRLLLVRAGIPEPEPNGEVFSGGGAYLGRPDLVWRRERVGLEYEGGRHVEEEQVLFDVERRETFADHGWEILRATKYDLRGWERQEALIARVRRRLDGRG